jgi:ATP-dependent helicase/nuclease subunit A
VHASKGLQAPIVYLPDTTRVPRPHERLLPDADGQARLWLPRSEDATEAARAWRDLIKQRAVEEQNRLLYVAMTRAEDRLYVGGWLGKKKQDSDCWYERITGGLRESGVPARQFDFTELIGPDGWQGEGFELVNTGRIETPQQQELALPDLLPLPHWVREAAPGEPDLPTPLAPSQPLPDETAQAAHALSPLGDDGTRRWQRGLLIHELLRHLPALPAAERGPAGRRFLGQPAHGLSAGEIDSWTAEALSVTEGESYRALFAAGSRAEVPLIGTVKTPRGTFTVSGQIDRLAVTDREVLIVDYKTNRPPPAQAADVPLAYRRQLALYRALLCGIYPGRPVRAFLLWTAAPLLMEIDAETLDDSMPYRAAS